MITLEGKIILHDKMYDSPIRKDVAETTSMTHIVSLISSDTTR